jgi:hypothetical protein
MFDQVLTLIQLVLAKLPSINLVGARRRGFARSLLAIHSRLIELCDNGDRLLMLLDECRLTALVNEAKLDTLVLRQEELIAELIKLLKSEKYVDVLQVKLPHVRPVHLVAEKKAQVEQIRMWLELTTSLGSLLHVDDAPASTLLPEYRSFGYTFLAPNEVSVGTARAFVLRTRVACAELRSLIDQTFSIDDLL